MAHYALINSSNIVVQVITGVDETVTQVGIDGTEVGGSSEAWEQFYESLPWHNGLTCKRTSYNDKIRKQFAGVGFTYLPDADVFVAPRPFASWVLDENHDWQPPTPMPTDGKIYAWFDENQQWIEVI